MSVRILHAADFHMDSPFHALPREKAALRRQEQRELLHRLVETAEDTGAQLVLLAGDLFDSSIAYWETQEMLQRTLGELAVPVFIAPGNHDYYTSRSPYAFMDLPENVHIFRSPSIKYVDLPELRCRVWGAGFASTSCDSLLTRFHAEREDDIVNLMVLHGDTGGGRYNAVSEDQIAASCLDYLALGHIHSFSGILRAGRTHYAYPGCLEGRGFDECGEKGVIVGEVDRGACDLRFRPIAGRQYKIETIDLTGAADPGRAVLAAVGDGEPENIVRLVLRGQIEAAIDLGQLRALLEDKYFHLSLRDETGALRGLWDGEGEDSLTGLFLSGMKARYEEARDDREREQCLAAVRYGLAALEGREAWRP